MAGSDEHCSEASLKYKLETLSVSAEHPSGDHIRRLAGVFAGTGRKDHNIRAKIINTVSKVSTDSFMYLTI